MRWLVGGKDLPSRHVIQCLHASIWPTHGYFVNHISIVESKVETDIIANKVPATTNYFTCLNKLICAKLDSVSIASVFSPLPTSRKIVQDLWLPTSLRNTIADRVD